MATNGSKSIKIAQDELIAVLNILRAELKQKYNIVVPRNKIAPASFYDDELQLPPLESC